MAWGLLAWALNKHRFLGTPSASLTHVSKWGLSTGDGKSLSFSLIPSGPAGPQTLPDIISPISE